MLPLNLKGYKEARDDSLELAEAYRLMDEVNASVYSLIETRPVNSMEGEDAADDPAFGSIKAIPDQA